MVYPLSASSQVLAPEQPFYYTSLLNLPIQQILAIINDCLPPWSAKYFSIRRAGQKWKTSKADLSFCIRKLKEIVACILTSFLQGLFVQLLVIPPSMKQMHWSGGAKGKEAQFTHKVPLSDPFTLQKGKLEERNGFKLSSCLLTVTKVKLFWRDRVGRNNL